MSHLRGKVILVTGASAGIGLACAETLVKLGATVVACARNISKLEEANKALDSAGQIDAIATDMTKEHEVLTTFKEIGRKYGKLDVLINNAGRSGSETGLVDGDFQQWKDTVDLNVLALTLATREAVKLIEIGGSSAGHIINVNSISGHSVPTTPGLQFYAASKHMVTALTEGFRKTLQPKKIKVTSLSPGLTRTEIMERTYGKAFSDNFFNQISYEMLSPKDVADAVVYILTAPAHVNIDELTITPLGQQWM